ncbi:MAG: 16S rRNA (guanine(966)-N(2))-methyltransferase RsmD [Simkaniaceae bacterium]|nr:16S rRNA (guanine(966)-N(2))-methyltransferase RsmD [Simkaniaceae bacterium]
MRLTGGIFKNRLLKSPKGQSTRPTSEKLRQAVFNILQHKIEGATFLDLFAGSGAMGLEALSRGALKATFVENHPEALKALYANIAALELQESSQVISQNAKKILPKLGSFDIIYVDPPYGADIDNLSSLLKPDALLLYESNHPITLSGLVLSECRSYGDTYLHFFSH